MELRSWKICTNSLRLGRQPMFNEASLLTTKVIIRIFYISKRRDFRKDLIFNCGEIALEIEDRKRIIIITDYCVIYGDIQPAIDFFQFTNMFEYSVSKSNES